MKIVSLFNGYSGGRAALDSLGVVPDFYFSSEIDKYANAVTSFNWPSTVNLGDVRKVSAQKIGGGVDLLLGGSPCQGFSYAGKRLNFNDPRSKLFFEFVRLLNELKPRFFLLENVVMDQREQDIISSYLGVYPLLICSSLLVPQKRPRLYWTNIPGVFLPKFSAPHLNEILKGEQWRPESVKGRPYRHAVIVGRRLNSEGKREDYNKALKNVQCLEVRKNDRRTNCITTVDKDNVLSNLPPGRYPGAFTTYKKNWKPHKIETLEQLQGLAPGYTSAVSENQRRKMIGNGWTVPVISHILKNTISPQNSDYVRHYSAQKAIF